MQTILKTVFALFLSVLAFAPEAIAQSRAIKPTDVLQPSAYVGVTATRGRVAYNTLGANSGTMSQTMHWSRDTIVNPTIVFGNFYVTNGAGEVTTGPGTLGVSICWSSPTNCANGANYTLCGNGPRTQATVVGLNTVTCNGVTIPNNTQFFVRMLQTNATGAVFSQVNPQSMPNQSWTPDCWITGNLSVTDMLTSGTFNGTTNCSTFNVFPLGIVSQTTRPSVVLIGTSRIQCGVDYYTDASGDCGAIARAVGPVFGYSNLGMSASTSAQYLANPRTYRDAFINAYFSHGIDEHCINDLAGATTAAQCVSNRTAIAALYPNLTMIGTTIEPSQGSSDNFNTTTNLTAPNLKVAQFNQLVRAGVPGEKGYFDVAAGADPARINQWAVAPNPYASSSPTTFSGTCSIATGATSVMTCTACTACTLTIGQGIVGTNVPPGASIASYGTNVNSLGVCTATCTYNLLANLGASVASTTISSCGWWTCDGLHMLPTASIWLSQQSVLNPASRIQR